MKSSDQRLRLLRTAFSILFFFSFLPYNLMFGLCFSTEALALMKFKERIEKDPFKALMNWGELPHCSWSGVVCSHNGSVVTINLEDLSLQGTLAPELGNLTHLKSLILRNNSFSGEVPKEVRGLQELEILDLCDNNFRQQFSFSRRRLLQITPPGQDSSSDASPPRPPPPPPPPHKWKTIDIFIPPPPPLTRGASPPDGTPIPNLPPGQPPPVHTPPAPPPFQISAIPHPPKKKASTIIFIIVGVLVGVLLCALAALLAFILLKNRKVTLMELREIDSSGELQNGFTTTGVPKLNLSELETACEDFSNIIGSTSTDATIYKGTLSTGSEIAVLSLASGSLQDWSVDLETQFQDKIQSLSQMNHKNFLNIIGYCHEDEPFNRMLVFEYAPNGSLFEHLHEQDAEHLDWRTRLRIAMGTAYCMEHMNSLKPKPIHHANLNSSSIYLTIDYAAKVSDFTFLNTTTTTPLDPTTNVFSFGVILHEIITGKTLNPDTSLVETKPVADPTLKSFDENIAMKLWEVVRDCLSQNQRPEMKEVVNKLKDITGITEETALPRPSPAWWAELEIISTEAN